MCKKQTSVSHSSTESEVISLDAGLRMDGISALDLWDLVKEVLHSSNNVPARGKPFCETKSKAPGWEKPHAKTVAWSSDMEGHAKKALRDIANWQTKRQSSHTKSQPHAWMIIISRRRNFNRLENCQKYARKLS